MGIIIQFPKAGEAQILVKDSSLLQVTLVSESRVKIKKKDIVLTPVKKIHNQFAETSQSPLVSRPHQVLQFLTSRAEANVHTWFEQGCHLTGPLLPLSMLRPSWQVSLLDGVSHGDLCLSKAALDFIPECLSVVLIHCTNSF